MFSLLLASGKWRDEHCAEANKYICARPQGSTLPPTSAIPPPGNCPSDWIQGKYKCFKMFPDKYNWTNARARCQAFGAGADLACISNSGENS